MEYRRVGNSGIKVSEISLGAWLTFGETLDQEETRACLKVALDNGINFIDMADVYAHGEAERFVGEALKDLGVRRQDVVLSSKVYWPMSDNVNDRGLSRKHIFESVHQSLKRIGTDYLDFYFCHRYDPETPLEEVVRAMDDLVHQGKVLYWGTSVWSAGQISDAVELAGKLNAYRPQVEQPRYNMFDRHIETEGILQTCAQNGIGITVFSPLAQGILTGKYLHGIPKDSRAARMPWLSEEEAISYSTKVEELSVIAGDLGISLSQLALAWILRRKEISTVITGASRPEHIVSNAKASGIKLSSDVLETIEAILS